MLSYELRPATVSGPYVYNKRKWETRRFCSVRYVWNIWSWELHELFANSLRRIYPSPKHQPNCLWVRAVPEKLDKKGTVFSGKRRSLETEMLRESYLIPGDNTNEVSGDFEIFENSPLYWFFVKWLLIALAYHLALSKHSYTLAGSRWIQTRPTSRYAFFEKSQRGLGEMESCNHGHSSAYCMPIESSGT